MDLSLKFWLTSFVFVAIVIDSSHGLTVVSGTVFCDQCKDGEISIFDFPIRGIKVQLICPGGDGEPQLWREETTNWLGGYNIRFDGEPDLTNCYVVVASGGASDCAAAAGSPKSVRLVFEIFGFEMYLVDPLLSQPAEPVSFCPRSAVPVPVSPVEPPPVFELPPIPRLQPFPPIPQLPPFPPVPYMEASACPYQKWLDPESICYWKVVRPDSKVAVVFGLVAASKYGNDLTLVQAIQGRGDPYRTLLREGTTALLNSYDNIGFPYEPLRVIQEMNSALIGGSTLQILRTALSFMRANSGQNTHATCRFTNCN